MYNPSTEDQLFKPINNKKCRPDKTTILWKRTLKQPKMLQKQKRIVEDTTGHQFDPIGNGISLSKKKFTKETFQLLNKNLNFVPTPSIFNKNQLNKELDDFFRLIKLKAYFKHSNMYNPSTEYQLFKPITNKKCRRYKNHTVETYTEATTNALETEENS